MATSTKEDLKEQYEDVKRAYDDLDYESKAVFKDLMDFVEEESRKAGIADDEDDAKPDKKKKKIVAYLPFSLLFLIPAVIFLIAGNLVGAIVTLIIADVYAGLATAQMMGKIRVLEAGHEAIWEVFKAQDKVNLEIGIALKKLEEKKGLDNEE